MLALLNTPGVALAEPTPPDGAASRQAASSPSNAATPHFDVGAIDVTGNTLLPEIEIERAIYPHTGPGRTIADIEAARADLEKAYRARGFDSVVVEIPQQSASAGVIRLAVSEAKVATLEVSGASPAMARTIQRQIPSLRTGMVPDLPRAQAEIAEANRLPGRQITPLLKPGGTPGTIDVELKVVEQHPLHATLQLSNDHSPNTRPLRLLASVRDDNLWGLGHALSATYVVAPQNRRNAEVFAGSYLAPIWGSPFSVLVYGYRSNSNVAALGGSNVLGNGYAIGLRGILRLPTVGNLAQSLSFGPDYKNFKEAVALASVADMIRTPINYVPLNASYTASLSGDKNALTTTLAVTAGLRPLSIGRVRVDGQLVDAFGNKRGSFGARSNFVHVNLDVDYTRSLPKDFIGSVRFSGQAADGPLISNEQFAAGGLTSVRGYLQSQAIGDEGVSGTIELRSPSLAPLLGSVADELRLYAFSDAGYARVLDALPGQADDFTLWSAGVGARFQFVRFLSGDLSVAFPLANHLRSRRPYGGFTVKADY